MSRYVLDLRAQEVGGPVVPGSLFRIEELGDVPWNARLPAFTAETRGQRLIVLIHGYNNSRSRGRATLGDFMELLAARGTSDPMLAVLWPGDGWAKALTYPFEGRDADDTADVLEKWLRTHVDSTAQIAFVAHSLGCRVAMRTAQRLTSAAGTAGAQAVDRICLMAPAIDNDALGGDGVTCYRSATLAAQRVAVLASGEDTVLKRAYLLGDLAQTVLFGERTRRALGYTGPKGSDQAVLERLEPVPLADSAKKVGHGDYVAKGPTGASTASMSDEFVALYLAGDPHPVWPAQRK